METNDYLTQPVFTRFTETVESKASRDSVAYWNDVSRLILNLAIALATLIYILRGGNLIRLSPAT